MACEGSKARAALSPTRVTTAGGRRICALMRWEVTFVQGLVEDQDGGGLSVVLVRPNT